MKRAEYLEIEAYMLSLMIDGAHDEKHVYRVLYAALDIAKGHELDEELLIAACLLHDIGRAAQFKDASVDHAEVGSEMAYEYLIGRGWDKGRAAHARACILTHRYRSDRPPESMEARILFDADKLDVAGTLGIARTLAYKGIVGEPLYNVDSGGRLLSGGEDDGPSFFQEYDFKLKRIYDRFYTPEAEAMAASRRASARAFYEAMVEEAGSLHERGLRELEKRLDG